MRGRHLHLHATLLLRSKFSRPGKQPTLGQDMLLIEPTRLKLIREGRENRKVGDLRRGEIDSRQARTRHSYHAYFQHPKDPSTSEQLGEQNSARNGALME